MLKDAELFKMQQPWLSFFFFFIFFLTLAEPYIQASVQGNVTVADANVSKYPTQLHQKIMAAGILISPLEFIKKCLVKLSAHHMPTLLQCGILSNLF